MRQLKEIGKMYTIQLFVRYFSGMEEYIGDNYSFLYGDFTLNKCDEIYVKEMLEFAKTLKGRELNETEKRIRQEAIDLNDKFHYFIVFGIQPETQHYIDYTIVLLEKCSDIGEQVICEVRLDFSVKELGVAYPKGSRLEKHWNEYEEWKKKKDLKESLDK